MRSILNELEMLYEAELQRLGTEALPLVIYDSDFIPEEMLRSAGLNTFFLRHGDHEAAEAAVDYTLECINPLARANVSHIINNTHPLAGSADMVATAYTDSHGGRMSELIEYKEVNVVKVGVPNDYQKDLAFEYYMNGLKRLISRVEELSGCAVDMKQAGKNFERSNELNEIFRQINLLRKSDEVPIGIVDYMRLQHLSLQLNSDQALELFKSALEALKKAEPEFDSTMPRLLIMGRAVSVGDYDFLRLVDESGCPVVAEILDECVRVLDSDVDTEGDLLENFARNRLKERLPVDSFQPSWKIRFARLKELIEEYRVDGVVWYQLDYDEIYDMEYSCVEKWLKEMGVPSAKVITDFDKAGEKVSARKARLSSLIKAAKKHRQNR